MKYFFQNLLTRFWTQKNFENVPIKFDNEKGIILIGQNLNESELGIRINKNVICGVDQKDILRCLYIIPDRFIQAS